MVNAHLTCGSQPLASPRGMEYLLCVTSTGDDIEFDGRELENNNECTKTVTMFMHNPVHFCWLMLLDQKMGLGETYMAGDWTAEPNPTELLKLLIRAKKQGRTNQRRPATLFNKFIKFTTENLLNLLRRTVATYRYIQHRIRDNTLTQSAKNIEEHYDLGNDMFRMFLDPSMTYSCALFEEHICFKYQDYRLTSGQYDKVISVEMVEAVGQAFLPQYFQVLSDRLAPGGIAVLQGIICPDAYYDRYCRSSDFIKKYIFPGGHMPSIGAIKASLPKDLTLGEMKHIGRHYAATLDHWYSFHRRWQYYFCLCSALFANDHIDTIQFTLTKAS
ncbi:unnamed protein product [Nippostrongylus brasiliensis]|uniref:Cyclopropane-fatty-acyl-phospholipid synthase n=1 Tax=Nippostrongylus brasiliensis TaxID=27835 RepID=A0A0N4YM90_NIPBR|nr:unnamed protein product [Nippostrongylus brasiliensis]